MSLRILIVGGYGVFGGRIVDLLADEEALTLIVAGRSAPRAQAFCAARPDAKAVLSPVVFDREGDIAAQIAALLPDMLIDASGPFQAYGEGQYRVIEACIAARVHYLDLADGSEFVAGVAAYDARARDAGIYVLSGVSSFPVLTAAAVRRLARDLTRVDTITGGIAPSPYAGVGENVIRAIASYAGQPVAVRAGLVKTIGRPFTEHRRFVIAPPGAVPIKSTMFSLVDVPDLRALALLWPHAKAIWMGAGPVPEILHRALIACAWLVRLGLVRSVSPLAPLMHWATNHVRWGEHRGGMFVEITGADADGGSVKRSWHMLAEGDDGPFIPAMAVEAIVRNHLAGRAPALGARAATTDLELEDYEKLFAKRKIVTGIRGTEPETAPLYQRLLGDAWARTPQAVRAMHAGLDAADGEAIVERGGNPLAHLIAELIGFPRAGKYPLRVDFVADGDRETWQRRFGEQRFQSVQYAGQGRSQWLLCERFGPLLFAMALHLEAGALRLVVRRWSAFGIWLPLWLAPKSEAFETDVDGVFQLHVEISHPLLGRIVRYRGQLRPVGKQRAAA